MAKSIRSVIHNVFCGDLKRRNEELSQQVDELQAKNDKLSQTNKQLESKQETLESEITALESKNSKLSKRVAELQTEDWPSIETEKKDKEFVRNALSTLDGWDQRQAYWWNDYTYRLPTRASFVEIAERDSIDNRAYQDEFFDCDDYADSFASLFKRRYQCNAVGFVLSPDAEPPHTFNVVVFADGSVELWEPQSDEFVTDDESGMYTLDGSLILV